MSLHWTDEEIADLRACWPLGETCTSIGARLGRDPDAVSAKAMALGLKSRRSDRSRFGTPGTPRDRARPMRAELPHQALAWGDIRFEDAQAACGYEPRHRGQRPEFTSGCGTAAEMCVNF